MADKLQLLKSLRLLHGVPDGELAKLGDFLGHRELADGQAVFEEGSTGSSLFFISGGHVRIAKRLRSGEGQGADSYKELAVLGPGDCFGEMALIEKDLARSASAIAAGPVVLLELGRDDLDRWLGANPQLAMGFFSRLVETLSGRLRRSSNELTLLFDLSNLLLEAFPSPAAMFDKAMPRIMQYLEGDWVSGAYLYNQFNDEMDLVDTDGDYEAAAASLKVDPAASANAWLDERTYQVVFPGEKRAHGSVVFHRKEPVGGEERNEIARTLTTTARLIASALVNIQHRVEEEMRSRLRKTIDEGRF
ncbi:MAG: cyclic nucleotide-binding domain-containing protein [Elusimicrobia bacterium]|nr:cyclic nucleotide-binding domain-containing protein [Elusimicrobiota bacterium]